MMLVEQLGDRVRPGASGWISYLVSAVFVLVSLAARLALGPWIEGRSPLALFVPAVVLAAGLYGVGQGLFAMVFSLVVASFVIIAPEPSGFTTPVLVSIAVFIATSQFMLIFANHLREARQRSSALESELQHAQTTAAMGTMASTLAHELNQPLTAASNYVAACHQFVAMMGDEKNAELLKGLSQAEDQIQRAGSIIREARSLLRDLSVARTETRLRDLFDRVLEVSQANDGGRLVSFTIDIASDARTAFVNAVQIEQVLLNIIRNSRQAMHGMEGPRIRLQTRAAEKGVIIQVHDNGPGIPPERLPGLFSAARIVSGSGLGIGLSICRTIVEAHGGSIMAQNAPDGGASFLILLPDEAESS